MALLLLNDKPAIEASIVLPLTGAWWAEVALDDRDPPQRGEAATLKCDGQEWVGTVFRAGVARGTALVRIVGGAGGLSRVVRARAYTSVEVRQPLSDLLRDAGEALDASTASADTRARPPFWTRLEGPAGEALRALAQYAGANWRVLPNGKIWFGVEKWQSASVELEALDEDPQAGRIVIWQEKPTLSAGVKVAGRKVARVEHRISSRVRTTAWFEDESDPDDLATALEGIVRHETAHVDFHAPYAVRIVKQNSDGTVELEPDDKRVPGLSKVPVRYGVGGARTKLKSSGRGVLMFANGSPAAPYLAFWENGDVDTASFAADSVKLGSDTAAKALALAEKVDSELSKIKTYLDLVAAHVHPAGTPNVGPSPTIATAPSISGVGSSVVKTTG